jgi:hypothetical protein
MFSKIKPALQTVAAQQHLALLLAWAATVQPLVAQPGQEGVNLGRRDPACLQRALRHPLVRLAVWIRHLRLRLLLRIRTASRTST